MILVDCRGEHNDDSWYEECNKEWQNLLKQIKCTFDYPEYEEVFVKPNKGVIPNAIESNTKRKKF